VGGRPRASPPAPRAGPEAVCVVHGPGPGSAPRPAAPRVDAYSRELLGDPCPTCAAIVNPKPKPKPQPRAKPGRAASHARIRAARAGVAAGQRRPLPAARASTRTSRPRRRPTPGELAAATSAGLTAGAIAYNRSRVDPLGIPRQRAAHLTGGTVW